ncbi:MAG: hypothetical protein AUI36_03080 [Cyanobacteria bacterium 13_1_40CM_2_61_4]|nr:MAG: hypothetical protein AUI36_03080 [Cyanobacteria bacterium 13_1_40CM_2_61_4]
MLDPVKPFLFDHANQLAVNEDCRGVVLANGVGYSKYDHGQTSIVDTSTNSFKSNFRAIFPKKAQNPFSKAFFLNLFSRTSLPKT